MIDREKLVPEQDTSEVFVGEYTDLLNLFGPDSKEVREFLANQAMSPELQSYIKAVDFLRSRIDHLRSEVVR